MLGKEILSKQIKAMPLKRMKIFDLALLSLHNRPKFTDYTETKLNILSLYNLPLINNKLKLLKQL